MSRVQSRHHALHHLGQRASKTLSGLQSIPVEQPLARGLHQMVNISKRDSTPTTTCAANNNTPQCQRPTGASTNTTLPIVLGAVIPITVAIIILIVLHRRHVKKLRNEDANDRHKSLDFGLEPGDGGSGGKKKGRRGKQQPPMTTVDLTSEKAIRHGRGMSMDLENPYLLPPGLQSSRESLHSLSRTIHSRDDRYRPATTFIPNDSSMPVYPNMKSSGDDSSSYTGSSGRGYRQEQMDRKLLSNAQRMSRNGPPGNSSSSPPRVPVIRTPPTAANVPRKGLPSDPRPGGLAPLPNLDARDSYMSKDGADLRRSNNYLGSFIHSRSPSEDMKQVVQPSVAQNAWISNSPISQIPEDAPAPTPAPRISITSEAPLPPRKQSLQAQPRHLSSQRDNFLDDDSEGGTNSRVASSQVAELAGSEYFGQDQVESRHSRNFSMPIIEDVPVEDVPVEDFDFTDLGYDPRRLSMGPRPLPPDDPDDNPERRANRIRSFYKEYFDDSKPLPGHPGRAHPANDYYEDYGQEFLGDGAVYDPNSGQFVVGQAPYAEPITRRAMTPPPRAPPQYQRGQMSASPNPNFGPRRARAYSSASGRFGPPRGGPPRKVLPPPSPLRTLPTPHLLKDDSNLVFSPIDFAPPTSYRDRQVGRPSSPRGEMRPYSPAVPAHLPLASAFNELPSMPSPHQLRKSGAFTALDFAPPPRFKNSDAGSDAGSIRSGRSTGSAMSASQVHSIRAGAYRVSRIPKGVVGTKNELSESLKPTWNLRS